MLHAPRNDSPLAPDDCRCDFGGPPSIPPYRFSGVRMRVFPIRARIGALERFCDEYINVFRDVAQFRPLDGFVELVILEYPSITSVSQPAFATYGQTEVFFLVPVLWKDVAGGNTRLAVLTPYIFVNNYTSARIGRDVFGWAKEAAWYHRGEDVSGSAGPYLAIDKESIAGDGMTPKRMLEVHLQATRERLSFGAPSDGESFSFDLNAVVSLARRPVRATQRALALWQRGWRGAFANWRHPTDVLNVNLKQLPQLEPTGTACYQALTVTPLHLVRLNGFGLLGERRQLRGDPSGGFVVRLFEDPTWPLVTKLGLDFEQRICRHDQDVRVAYEFKPVFPIWLTTDFEQQPSRILASRGTPADNTPHPPARVPLVGVLGSRSLLGTTRYMRFPGMHMHALSFSANLAAQERLIGDLNGLDADYCFAAPPPTSSSSLNRVMVNIMTMEGMRTEQISVENWKELFVELYVPVLYWHRNSSAECATTALFSYIAFSTSSTFCNAIHDSIGGYVVLADLDAGEPARAKRATNEHRILSLSARVVRHFQLGETAEVAPVLMLYRHPSQGKHQELSDPVVSALCNTPLLRLKQLPSAEQPEKTSYQALIKSNWSGFHVAPKDLTGTHELAFYEYESLQFASRLGLCNSEAPSARATRNSSDGPPKSPIRCRALGESQCAFNAEATLRSEVLWERLSR